MDQGIKYIELQSERASPQVQSQQILSLGLPSQPIELQNVQNSVQQLFFCEICQQYLKLTEKSQLQKCHHLYCKSCLRQYMIVRINQYQQIKCPEDKCENIIDTANPVFLQLDPKTQIKYNKNKAYLKMLVKNPKGIMCPNGDCTTQLISKNFWNLLCQTCQTQYCKKCLLPSHSGRCKKNQPTYFRSRHGFNQCGNCKKIIQKNQGCNHITCHCKYEFCYICGDTWSAEHSRDCQQPHYDDLTCCGKVKRNFSSKNIKRFVQRNCEYLSDKCSNLSNFFINIGGQGKFGKFLRIFIKLTILLPLFLMYLLFLILVSLSVFVLALVFNILIYGPKIGCQSFPASSRTQKVKFILKFPIYAAKGIKERIVHIKDICPGTTKLIIQTVEKKGKKMLFW